MKTVFMVPNKERIYSDSVATSKTWKNKLELSNQQSLKFKPNRLRETIETVLEGPMISFRNSKLDMSGKVVVLAGFTANYSCGLKEAGFNVIHTDLCDTFVALGKKLGLKSMKAHAENPPKFEDTLFYTSFEFVPIHYSASSEILMFLRTMSHSTYGYIEASLWDSTPVWNHLRKVYNFDSTIWRTPIAIDNSGHESEVSVVRYYVSNEQKYIFKTDLEVIDAINEIQKEKVYFHELAARIKIKNNELTESLDRIDAAMRTKLFNEKTKSTIREIEIV